MRSLRRNARFVISIILFLFLLLPLSAESFLSNIQLSGVGGLLILATDGSGGNPSAILPSLGVFAALPIREPLRIEGSLDVYFTNYEFNTEHSYPIACSPENRSAFVIGLVTAVQATGYFPLGDNGTAIRVFGGPAADLRLVFLAFGLHPNDLEGDIETNARLQTNAIRKHFWSGGRWFMPVLGAGMDFPLSEKLLLGFDLRAWFPIYKLWTNDNTPSIDGWRFGVGLRLTPRKNTPPRRVSNPVQESPAEEPLTPESETE